MNPGLWFADQLLALLVIGRAQHRDLVSAFRVVQYGEGQRKEHVDPFNGVLASRARH